MSILLGNGDGSFQPARNYAGPQPFQVTVGDFNQDGIPDLSVVGYGTDADDGDGTVAILLGNGDGTFQAAQSYAAGTGPTSVAVGDFNGDGFPDLALTNDCFVLYNTKFYFPSGTVTVLINAVH